MFEASFGEVLRVMRRAAGLSQEDLAAASGSSVRTIRELEQCRVRSPQRRTVLTMADALRLSGDDRSRFLSLAQAYRFGGSDARAARSPFPDEFSTAPRWAAHTPRQLPAPLPDLVGRATQLAMIRAMATALRAGQGRSTCLMVIHGAPGIGKTSLAIAGAHEIADQFPDGQLFADLRGSHDDGLTSSTEALAQLLRSLAVPEQAIPAPGTAREGLLRTLLWDRRMLIVLDDAYDEAQVRPLLPANGRSMVLITAARPLSGLDAARRMRLDVLAHDHARAMLGALIGGSRAAADRVALDSIIRLCGHWPLALRVAGNRLTSGPSYQARHLADQLRDRRFGLTALTAGDLDVRAALAVAYDRLSPSTARALRHAAAIPAPAFSPVRVAAVAGLDVPDAELACDELVDAGLLQVRDGRLHLNNLVRLFAAERLHEAAPSPERELRWLVGLRPYRTDVDGPLRAGI